MKSLKSAERTGMVSKSSDKPVKIVDKLNLTGQSGKNGSKIIKPSQFSQPQIRQTIKINPPENRDFRLTSGTINNGGKVNNLDQLGRLLSGLIHIKLEPQIQIVPESLKMARGGPIRATKINGGVDSVCSRCHHQEDDSFSESDIHRDHHHRHRGHEEDRERYHHNRNRESDRDNNYTSEKQNRTHGNHTENQFRVKTSKIHKRHSATESNQDGLEESIGVEDAAKFKVIKKQVEKDKARLEKRRTSVADKVNNNHKSKKEKEVEKGREKEKEATYSEKEKHVDKDSHDSKPVMQQPTHIKPQPKVQLPIPISDSENNVPKVKQRLSDMANGVTNPISILTHLKKEESLALELDNEQMKKGKFIQKVSSHEIQDSVIEKKDYNNNSISKQGINGRSSSPDLDKKPGMSFINTSPEDKGINSAAKIGKTPAFNMRPTSIISGSQVLSGLKNSVPESSPEAQLQSILAKHTTSQQIDSLIIGSPTKPKTEIVKNKGYLPSLLTNLPVSQVSPQEAFFSMAHYREIAAEAALPLQTIMREKLIVLLKEYFEGGDQESLEIYSAGIPSPDSLENLEFSVKVEGC